MFNPIRPGSIVIFSKCVTTGEPFPEETIYDSYAEAAEALDTNGVSGHAYAAIQLQPDHTWADCWDRVQAHMETIGITAADMARDDRKYQEMGL